jgi:hypothetical protein
MGGGNGGAICPNVATLFGLAPGDSCFDVVAVQVPASDGCHLGVATTSFVGHALPFHYEVSTGTVSIGTMGVLGVGPVRCNVGSLSHDVVSMLDTMPACSRHQLDMSTIHMTATNEFDITVTETQDTFKGCSDANTPQGGNCVSTWTWHMKHGVEIWPACR